MHGPLETGLPAEGADQFNRCAEPVEWRDPENVGVVEIEHAVVGILVEQRIEHGASLTSIFREHVPLFNILGPLTAGQWFGVEGDVTDEIEGVEILTQLSGRSQPAAGPSDSISSMIACLRSAAFQLVQEVVKAREAPAQGLSREIAQRLGHQLAVPVEVGHPLGHDGHLDAVNIDLLPWPRPRWRIPSIDNDLAVVGSVRVSRRRIGWRRWDRLLPGS